MRAVRRLLLVHRRGVAATLAGLAVLTGLQALAAPPPGEVVVVAAHDLPAGHVLEPGDLTSARTTMRPASARSTPSTLVGRRVAAPLRRGEPVTDRRLVGRSLLAGYGTGTALATVVVPRDDVQAVGVGDLVSVVATDPDGESDAAVVARGARVVMVSTAQDDGRAVALAVDEQDALAMASARLRARLSLLVTS